MASPVSSGFVDERAGGDDPFGLHLLSAAPSVSTSPPSGAPPSPPDQATSIAAEPEIRALLERRIAADDARAIRARANELRHLFAAIPTNDRDLLRRRLQDHGDPLGQLMMASISSALRRDLLALLSGDAIASTEDGDLEIQQFAASLGPGRFGVDKASVGIHSTWAQSQPVNVFVRPGVPSPPGEAITIHWFLHDRTGEVAQSGTVQWSPGEGACEPWSVDISGPGQWQTLIEVVAGGRVIATARLPVLARASDQADPDLVAAIGASDPRVAAEGMSNSQLAAQAEAVRAQLGTYELGNRAPDDERQVGALRDALRELEWQGRRRTLDGNPALQADEPGDLSIEDARSDGTARPQDRALIQRRLDALIALRGFAGAEDRIKELEAELGADEASIHGGATSSPVAVAWLHDELAARRREASAFFERFDEAGRSIAYGLLAESEARVRNEIERYQLNEVQPGGGYAGQGLRVGANAGELRDAVEHGKRIQSAYAALMAAEHARPRDGSGDESADEARRAFELVRATAIARHPMLRAFLEGDTQQARVMPSGLVPGALDVGKYAPEHFAKFMGWELNQKLVDIDETRSNIGDGTLSVFGVPKLVDLTRQEMRVASGTMLDGAINERVANPESSFGWTQGLIAAISLGLGLLLAVPTGGTSVQAGVAVAGELTLLASDLYLMGKQFDELGIYRAAANTDVTPIDSLLQQEPSAGPLIFAFLGFAAPVAGVAGVARSGRDLTHALARARESVVAVSVLRASARAASGDLSAPEVVEHITKLRALGREAGLSDGEIDSMIRTVSRGATGAARAVSSGGRALESAAKVTDEMLPDLALQLGVSRIVRGGDDGVVGVRPTLVEGRVVVEEVVVGAHARVADVLAHAETIERLGRYNGLLGHVRSTWDELRVAAQGARPVGRNPHAPFTRAHEAFEEVRKYEGFIRERIRKLAEQLSRGGPSSKHLVSSIEDEIRLMEGELSHWNSVLDEVRHTGDPGIARGMIESRDISGVTREAISAGYPKPPSDEYFYRRWPGGGPDGQEFQLLKRGVAMDEATELQPSRGPGGWTLSATGTRAGRADLDRIRKGPSGRIRDVSELDNTDVAAVMNAQLQNIEVDEIEHLVDGFPAAQREHARVVLARSSGFGNMESLNKLREAIAEHGSGLPLFAPGSGSLADNLLYVDSKHAFANMKGGETNLVKTGDVTSRCVVILDDVVLHRLSSDQAFARALIDTNSVLIEPHGFVSGSNMFNSGSANEIAKRTESLLKRSEELFKGGGGRLTFAEAVDTALNESTRSALHAADSGLAAKVHVARASDHADVSSAAIGRQLNGDAGISAQDLADAFASAGFSAEQRSYARELLARQSEVYSPRRFANELGAHHQTVMAEAARRGVAPENVYFYIPLENKSYGMLAMAHREATGTAVERYINGPAELTSRALGRDSLIVILDDVAGSGESLRKAVKHADNTPFQGQFIVAPMVSTEMSRDVFVNAQSGAMKDPKVAYTPRRMSDALTDSEFYKGLDPDQRRELLDLVDDRGYGGNALSMVFPYMAPDNNNSMFGDLFAKFFIMNKNSKASRTATYKGPRGGSNP